MKNKELGVRIKGFEDYVITSEGQVWSFKQKKPRNLKPQKASQSRKGYLQVRLFNDETRRGDYLQNGKVRQKGKLHYIHRLVWENFVGEIPEDKEIDHKDGNTKNNSVHNLQVITRRENLVKYAKRLSKENNRMYMRTRRDEVLEDFKKLRSMPKVAKKWNCSEAHIRRIIKNIYFIQKNIDGKPWYTSRVYDESINDKWMNTDLRNKRHDEEFWL